VGWERIAMYYLTLVCKVLLGLAVIAALVIGGFCL
jgi:hypothetical protein